MEEKYAWLAGRRRAPATLPDAAVSNFRWELGKVVRVSNANSSFDPNPDAPVPAGADPAAQPPVRMRKKVKVRWWHILLIAFFVVAFLGLAYWQWTRFRSGSGSFQNLGYAFQWPLFAAFTVYAYKTAMAYENDKIEAENAAAREGDTDFEYDVVRNKNLGDVTKIDEDFLPQRPQIDVETFNQLNTQRRRAQATPLADAAPDDPTTTNQNPESES